MDKIKALRPKFSTPTDVVICLGHFVINTHRKQVKNTMDLALVKGSSHKEDLVSRVSFVDVMDKGLNT